jgi:hypothetical protein
MEFDFCYAFLFGSRNCLLVPRAKERQRADSLLQFTIKTVAQMGDPRLFQNTPRRKTAMKDSKTSISVLGYSVERLNTT